MHALLFSFPFHSVEAFISVKRLAIVKNSAAAAPCFHLNGLRIACFMLWVCERMCVCVGEGVHVYIAKVYFAVAAFFHISHGNS